MAIETTQIFLGSTPIPFYYVGEDQVGLNPLTTKLVPLNGLVYAFDATNVNSYPGSGSIWNDLSSNRAYASVFSSSVFPTYNGTNKEFVFNGTNQALMATISSSIATGSIIQNFTQIMWVKLANVGTDAAEGIVNLQTSYLTGAPDQTVFDAISFNESSDVWRLTSNNNNRNVTSVQTETVFNDYLFVAATRESGTNNYKIYRNGANVIATGSYTPFTYTVTGSLPIYSSIGNRFFNGAANAWNPDGWWSGSLSSVILYNRVLSDNEISSIYSAGRDGIDIL